jgi:nitrogen fixation NifU-like protein
MDRNSSEEYIILDHYSEIAISHFKEPQNRGYMPRSNSYACLTGPCGDTMEIWIRLEDCKITDCSFETDGCHNAVACCSMAAELATGSSLEKAYGISQGNVLEALGRFPEEGKHCALLASNTLKRAIELCRSQGALKERKLTQGGQ